MQRVTERQNTLHTILTVFDLHINTIIFEIVSEALNLIDASNFQHLLDSIPSHFAIFSVTLSHPHMEIENNNYYRTLTVNDVVHVQAIDRWEFALEWEERLISINDTTVIKSIESDSQSLLCCVECIIFTVFISISSVKTAFKGASILHLHLRRAPYSMTTAMACD